MTWYDDCLKHLLYHGVLGYRDDLTGASLSGEPLLATTRSVFLLIPRDALASLETQRPDAFVPIKPIIRTHLESIGVPATDLMLDVVKSLVEQYAATQPRRRRLRKQSIADLRALRVPYARLRSECNGRCHVCGIPFAGAYDEHLDHVVPFRLIGDVADGANWRLLCGECNVGKSESISPHSVAAAYNWLYGTAEDGANLRTRWVSLAINDRCMVCSRGPGETQLFASVQRDSHFFARDLVTIRCEDHRDGPPLVPHPLVNRWSHASNSL